MSFDRKSLERLLVLVKELEQDHSRLDYTVGEIEALLNSLSKDRDVWRSELARRWGSLDDLRGLMAFNPGRIGASEREKIILTATGHLNRLLSEQLGLERGLNETTTLWRPVGPAELELIRAAGMREFPPRLPDQPLFYPVLSEDYAVKIARDWNVPASGSGFVTRFEVSSAFLAKYDVQDAGGRDHREYWMPADELAAFNAAIVGVIEVTRQFPTEFHDAKQINNLLREKLERLGFDQSGWRQLYRHRDTGRLWELDYPQSEMHGGGPRRLRELDITDVEKWTVSEISN